MNFDTSSSKTTSSFRKPRKVGKLYHPKSSNGYVSHDFYTRVYVQGTQYFLNLGLGRQQAKELDFEARARLRAGESVLSVKAFIAKRLQRTAADLPPCVRTAWCSIGDIIAAHEPAYFSANPKSTRTYRRSFLNMVEAVALHRAGKPAIDRRGRRVTTADYAAILDVPSTFLDDVCVATFRALRMANVVRGTKAELSAQGSFNAILQFAKSMFSHEAMVVYKAAGLNLPDLSSFLQSRAFSQRRNTYVPPPDDLIIGIHAGLRQLAFGDDEPLFLAVAMALFAGLRHDEIVNAHSLWLQATCGPTIVVRISETFVPKGKRERSIPVPDWLYARLRAATVSPGYVIGSSVANREAVCDRALAWLREHGLAEYQKPLHFLRGLYAGYLVSRLRVCDIKGRLGHMDITTTFRHYAEFPFAEPIAGLWEVSLPSAAPVTILAPALPFGPDIQDCSSGSSAA